ncbi:MAG: UDP-2,3-diacylglucosamine diphosphatase [Bacteroidota bacterium]|nr:UDP-2,3-diacylglucosamine diphosphatase [Bacteroidota bacterium]
MKKIYFASDFHLGIPDEASSFEREKRIVKWLAEIKEDCAELFIVGDIFDFWFEYNLVVPKGFVRLQAKFAEYTDSGIPVHFFHGNHDLWQFGYFEKELGVQVHTKPIIREFGGKKFFIGHGDGLGPGQFKFKLTLAIYRNYFFQRLFAFFHPSIGMSLANWLSKRSKLKTFDGNFTFYEEKEFLIAYCRGVLQKEHYDYFIFGHRHLPLIFDLNAGSKYINLGDWIGFNSYAVFDGTELKLETFTEDK